MSGDAVEEEIDGVVEVGEEVIDGLGLLVGHSASLPVGLADQNEDTRTDEDEEGQGCAQTHHSHLDHGPLAGRRDDGVPDVLALDLDQGSDDKDVTEDDDGEWNEVDDDEDDPGPYDEDVVFKSWTISTQLAHLKHSAVLIHHQGT